ncbi:molybdate ABC transporter substrate-binding protein [Pseudactinotalea terrae]|uniref:molybdate ABC transporter substrate-binding protein n=1 Tax=Pseudactinotalea terrae TaxID=1743262 RepID=UPI0012E17446|nr:substrate-binding domain-containing protein [Pseudactinotalea terrae]
MTSTPTTLTLFSGLALKDVLEDAVLPAYAAGGGHQIDTVYEPTSALVGRIREGQVPDLIIGVADSLHELATEGILDGDRLAPLVRSGLGVATLPGAPVPALRSVEEFVVTLRSARSVAYSRGGASGIYFAGLLERLGIADDVNSRATIVPGGFTGEALLDGRADLAVQQVIELRSVPGVRIAGTFPPDMQHYIDLWLGRAAAPAAPAAVATLQDFLTSAVALEAYTAAGLEVSDRADGADRR